MLASGGATNLDIVLASGGSTNPEDKKTWALGLPPAVQQFPKECTLDIVLLDSTGMGRIG